jgi:hypothetical protein
VHHAVIGAVAVFLAQDARHVVVGVAGMDDQRQPGFLCGGDMHPKAVFLHLGAVRGVVIIQTALADADEFRMRGQPHQILHRDHRLGGGGHRMRAGGIEDVRVSFGDGAHLWFLPEFGADRDHPFHTRRAGAIQNLRAVVVKIGKVEMAMAVGDANIGVHTSPSASPSPGPTPLRSAES